MSDTSLLKMPEHNWVTHEEGGRPANTCRASRVPGYALEMPDGRLHCNRCGWVTPEPVITYYSPDTDKTYLTSEDLTSAEANGWVVVGTSTRPGTVPVVTGPYEDHAEAVRARARLARKWRKQEARDHGDGFKIKTYLRPLWKERP